VRKQTFSLLLAVLIPGWLTAPAWAQQRQDVVLSPVEVALGITINAIFQDVNAAPTCVELSLPCTNAKPSQFGGFGLDLAVARTVRPNVAIVSDVSAFETEWQSPDSLRNHGSEMTRVTSVVLGPRISTDFFYAGHDPEPGRFFGQLLLGAQASGGGTIRPTVLVGGGTDVLIPGGHPRGTAAGPLVDMTMRMALDYRLTPGAGRNFSGWRFTLGFVLGPHLRH
jgi:hypothetical protein